MKGPEKYTRDDFHECVLFETAEAQDECVVPILVTIPAAYCIFISL
jgi:hypothetical protein